MNKVICASILCPALLGLCSWLLDVGGLYRCCRLHAETAHEWPQFHGPRRDNKSGETGLVRKWPDGGPELMWSVRGIGEGFSAVAVAGGRIYTTGNIGDHTVITALDLESKVRWKVENGPAYRRSKPGTRSTPTICGGRLYHENADGDVVCLDARTGAVIWAVNILERYKGRNIEWALAESLLIDGENVICTPGGSRAGLVALDKNTGNTVWICKDTKDKPGYCSPILVEHNGTRQVCTLMAESVVGVDANSGELLWRVEHRTPFDENIPTPIYHDGCLFVTTRSTGARLLKLRVRGGQASVEQLWHTRDMDNQHGGVVLLDGYVYGSTLTARGGPWVCLEFKTGKRVLADRGIGRVSLTFADGLLYLVNHRRRVALVRPSPRTFDLVSSFEIPRGGQGPTWAHPVVCGGRLYIRHGDFLYCYGISQPKGESGKREAETR